MPEFQSVNTNTSSPSPPLLNSTAELNLMNIMKLGAGANFFLKHQNLRQELSDAQRNTNSNSSFQSGGQSPHSVATALSGGTPTSLFTIDSILAPTHKSNSNQSSPRSPPTTHSPTPVRPTRVQGIMHHPSLHLSHLAAAAASGFNATSDFLGEFPSEAD